MRAIYIGLWNTYRGPFSEPHKRLILRAANLCEAFSLNLATFGFGKRLKDITGRTTIGKGGITAFLKSNKFYEFEKIMFPPQLGKVIATTKNGKPHDISEIRSWAESEPLTFLFGAGPNGLPITVIDRCSDNWDLSGKNYSLETATALGVLCGKISGI